VKRLGKLLVSLAVTLLFGWWAFRDTDWHQQWASLGSAHYGWIFPYFLILTGIHLCRTVRWGALLSGLEKVPFRPLNEAAGIGFMMLIVLPFRLGEFARPFLIAQRSGIKKSAAMTSVVLERIADGLSIAVLLRVLMLFMHGESPQIALVRFAANATFVVFGGGFVFLLFARWQHERAVRLVRGTLGLVSPKAADRVAAMVDTFVGALRQLPSKGQLAIFFGLTAVYWALNGLGMAVLAKAFNCDAGQLGCQPMSVSVFQGFVLLCVLVVGVMIPSAPGMVGTFQAAVKLGLSLFLPAAVVNGSGLAFANVLWLCQTTQQILFGLVLMSASGGSFSDLAGKLGAEAEPA
jgi:uncharacterized protein (TIRG00374 family)